MLFYKAVTVNFFRCSQVVSSPDGRNVCFVQRSPISDLTLVPEIGAGELSNDMLKLYENSSEYDTLHDLRLRCQNKRFYLHRLDEKFWLE